MKLWLIAALLAASPAALATPCDVGTLAFRVQWLSSEIARVTATSTKVDCPAAEVSVSMQALSRSDGARPAAFGGRCKTDEPAAPRAGGRTAAIPIVFPESVAGGSAASPVVAPAGERRGRAPSAREFKIVLRPTAPGSGASGDTLVDFTCLPLLDDAGMTNMLYTAVQLDSGGVSEAHVPVLDPHRLRVDTGISLVMTGDSTFESHPEIALSSTSRWFGPIGAMVDARYTNATPSAAAKSSATTNGVDAGTSGTFEGTVRVLFYAGDIYQWTIPAFALVGGAGLRSASGSTATSSFLGGVRINVMSYNGTDAGDNNLFAGSRSFVELGYAYDRFWSQGDRFYTDAQLQIPGLKTKWVGFMIGAHMDRPFLAHGLIDLRISALASIDPKALSGFFGMGE